MPDYQDPHALANDFGQFFVHKIEIIQERIDEICENESIKSVEEMKTKDLSIAFSEFNLLTGDEVKKIITKSASKNFSLDLIPTCLLKKCLDLLLPIITKIINLSLCLEFSPSAWKCALVIPLSKKFGLDLIFKSFRPVSNLHHLSKLTESVVVTQLRDHKESNGLIPAQASSCRKYHSTETALFKV